MSESQNVLITGASSGFGKLTTQTLIERGQTVFATMRDPDGRNAGPARKLRDFAQGKPGQVHVLELDVTDDDSVHTAVETAVERGGRIDALVNNAGYGVGGLGEAFTLEQWRRIFEVNVFGVQRVSRAVLPHMRTRGSGLLVQVSSLMGRVVLPFAAPYTATKWALEGMSESYRYELAGTGVDVVVVEPGGFGTSFGENMVEPEDEDRVASYGPLSDAADEMWSGIMENLQGDDAPDPQLVADAIADLIETPAGQRPLRTVVDPLLGGEPAEAVNATSREVQKNLFEGFDMKDMLSVQG